jgi:hypothetical protein
VKTLITGQPRTGTTALFLRLQAQLPPDGLALFEPPTLEGTGWATAPHSLVKTLVASLPGQDTAVRFNPQRFERHYVLVRDPRDRLISLLLFLPHWHTERYAPLWQVQPKGLDRYLAALAQKVAVPRSLPTWALFERLMGLRFGLSRGDALPTLEYLQQTFVAWHLTLPASETVHYEALYPVTHHGQLVHLPPRAYARIFRRGASGEWGHWFTPEDVDYFRPVFQPYLTWYGYGENWALPEEPRIGSVTSTDYVAKWLRVDRRRAAHATP